MSLENGTLTRHWVREIDRRAINEFGMSGLVLMENAARGAVELLLRLGAAGPVAIACGRGNNAGDGFAMARLLDERRVPAKVLLWSDPAKLTGDAAANFAILQKCQIQIKVYEKYESESLHRELRGCDWIVDALLGTGASGPPRSPLDHVIDHLNRHPAQRLAIDLPSGLDCDTGVAAPTTIRADHTVTFVALKPGLAMETSRPYVGQLHVAHIGAPRVLVEEVLRLAAEDSNPQ